MKTKEEVEKEFEEEFDKIHQPDKIQQHQKFSDRDMIDFCQDVVKPFVKAKFSKIRKDDIDGLVEEVEEFHKKELEELEKSNNREESKIIIKRALIIYKNNFLEHLQALKEKI